MKIHYLNENGWEELNTSGNSIRFITEHTGADNIKAVEKLAEYIGFGFDVYVFVDPATVNDKKMLVHFTDKSQAEREYARLIETI